MGGGVAGSNGNLPVEGLRPPPGPPTCSQAPRGLFSGTWFHSLYALQGRVVKAYQFITGTPSCLARPSLSDSARLGLRALEGVEILLILNIFLIF